MAVFGHKPFRRVAETAKPVHALSDSGGRLPRPAPLI